MSSANYKGQRERKPTLPLLHQVIPPLMLKLLFVGYLRVTTQATSSAVLSCRGLSVAMREERGNIPIPHPLAVASASFACPVSQRHHCLYVNANYNLALCNILFWSHAPEPKINVIFFQVTGMWFIPVVLVSFATYPNIVSPFSLHVDVAPGLIVS